MMMKFPYQIGIPSTVHDNDGNDNNNYNNIGKKYFSLPSTFQTEFHPNSCFHYHSMNSLHNNNERIAVCHHNHYQHHQHHHHHYNSDWTNRRPWTILILIINIIFVSIIIGSTEAIQSITEVSTVSGSSVDIPCNTTWIEDEVSLVLWFRGDTGVPIYRVDARNVPLSKAIHTTSDESRKRLYFDMKQQPPVLRIKPVMASDAAEYRCRVDFRQSRTQNVIVLLNVTVPPKELLIMDVEGQKLEGVIGPYDEGSNVILICEAEGGKPSPSVNWYQANRLIDSTYTIGPHGLVRNELNIRNLNRSDFMSILTCRASNNNVTEPISATVILDMNLRPIDVKILPKSYLKSKSSSSSSSHNGSITSSTTFMIDPRLSFILPAGSKAEFQCQSTGSRPAAQISWWLGNERLSSNVRDSVNEDGNATVSTIVFVPSVEDNGKLLTCRADNLPMPHTALKDERLLNVQFAPQLRISFGTNIQIDSIREGSDVYMECHVKANPPVKEVVWLHEDRPIHSLMSGDPNMLPDDPTLPTLSSSSSLSMAIGSTVIMTNQSLVIQKVHRSHRGRYQCVAFNEQGETVSDPLYLKVNFAPSCKPGQKLQYGVSRNEQIRIRCEVDAEPSTDLTFRWTLNTSGSGETSVEWASFTVNATTSIATYRPESSLDYGTLSCLAQNSIGIQNKPCIYSVVPAGRPDAVRGCAITNHSMSTLLVECIPGDDGGLRQHFNLEVYIGSTTNLGSSSNIGNGATIINANNKVVDQTLAAQSASIATTTTTTSINSNSLLQHPQRLHSNHSSSQPNFIVSSLTPGTPYTLVLYATNAKGRSHSVSLSAVTLSSPEKHTARGSFEQIVVHPILGILIGIVATIVITVIILILLIRSRIGGNNNANGSRSTGINNCSGNNNGHNNHNDNNHRKRRNNKQQKQSPQSSSSSPSMKTTVAFTRPSLNGTNSTMMMATTTANNNNNNNADDDDNNIDGSIDLSANDALLAIGSTISPSIITSNGDMKLKRIKHEQTHHHHHQRYIMNQKI
nr:nephrin-like isoform X2 [Dermatophagoides farinae]